MIQKYSILGIVSIFGTLFIKKRTRLIAGIGMVKNARTKLHLSVITCECGYKILLVPDGHAMCQAIERHVLEHKNKGANDAEANRIEDALISQVFHKAAESQ